jgi:hypothetical protein
MRTTRALAPFRDAGDQLTQDRRQGMAGDGLEQLDAEGGADSDRDLSGIRARRRDPSSDSYALALGGLMRTPLSAPPRG